MTESREALRLAGQAVRLNRKISYYQERVDEYQQKVAGWQAERVEIQRQIRELDAGSKNEGGSSGA